MNYLSMMWLLSMGLQQPAHTLTHQQLSYSLALDTSLLFDQEGSATGATASQPTGSPVQDYGRQIAERRELGLVHRGFGIATWGAMTVTVALGFIQYYNLYGFGAARENTPCVTGGAVFGQDQCSGVSWPHRIAAITTTTLYSASFILSLIMPDPNDLEHARGDLADRLRIHKLLRWVHLAGMVLQTFLGLGVANNWFGDRANNYGTLQTIAGIHQGVGWVTWGALTAAAAVMIF